MKLSASVHRDKAEMALEIAEETYDRILAQLKQNPDHDVTDLRDGRDYWVAAAHVHAILAKGWN